MGDGLKSDDLKTMLANASRSTQRLNAGLAVGDTGQAAELERLARNAPLAKGKIQKATRGRFLVCVTSYRRRLLDQDNLAEKYHVDLCRYAGALPADSPDQTRIEVSQVKAGKGEPERTKIEVWRIA
jgi:hypothetical protein